MDIWAGNAKILDANTARRERAVEKISVFQSEVLFHVQENAFEKGIRLLPEQIDALYEKLLPFAQISPELKEMHNEDVRKKQAGDMYSSGK